MLDANFIEAINRLARRSVETIELPDGGIAIMRPDGVAQAFPPVDKALPSDIHQNVSIFDAASFVAYVNRFKMFDGPEDKTEKTTIFSNLERRTIKAVIDYHSSYRPDRCAHMAYYEVPWSDQWRRWREIDGKAIGQGAFAEFLEENAPDVVEPASAVMLDIVTNLQSKKSVHFESGVRLQDGAQQLVFSESVETKGRGSLTIPSRFSIGVPIFQDGDAYKVECLLRYRIQDGAVAFTVKLHRRQFLERTAFEDVTKKISEATKLPVLNAWVA